MKIALVIDYPSVDAKPGQVFSDWEWQVTQELLAAAGLRQNVTLRAFPAHQRKWTDLFVGGKPGGPPIPEAEQSRAKLWADLAGYDLALTMGPYAMFALTGETKIDTYRGTHIDSPFVPGLQVVPTYSPELYSRFAWNERPIVVAAMRKARSRYVDKPRTIYIPETLADFKTFEADHIRDQIAFDVETNVQCRITEFSISPTSTECLYVQLEDRAHNSVWSEADELGIWLWLHRLTMRRDLTWVMHNATYDLSYMDAAGLRPLGHIADTMLRHHAYQPEWEKSLGFLASLHIPGRAWKHLRTQAKKNFNKAGAL